MTHIAKMLVLSSTVVSVLLITGCASSISQNINDSGHIPVSDVIFPELTKAWQNDGIFPNQENLTKIRPGIGKDSLYQLIGRPHFSESQHAREWDYIFKFYQDNGSIQTCQYKVIFDKDYHAQEFYWYPASCQQYVQNTVAPMAVKDEPSRKPIMSERINLSVDALFAFDKSQINDVNPEGQRSLNELATKLRDYQSKGDSQVVIKGYTDRLGDDSYNMKLSNMRAQTVKNYLVNLGVNPETMIAVGAGETDAIKYCQPTMNKQALIDCLQPNRRVQVDVNVYAPRN